MIIFLRAWIIFWSTFVLIVTCDIARADTLEKVADTTYVTSQVLTFLDWRMTRDCIKRDDCEEANPITRKIIGRKPEPYKLDLLMLGIMAGNHWLQTQLPTGGRVIYNGLQTYLRYDAVDHHFEIGLKVNL